MELSEVKPGMYIVDSEDSRTKCISYILSVDNNPEFDVIYMYFNLEHGSYLPGRLVDSPLYLGRRLATEEEINQFEFYRKIYGI